jgi:Ca2+-binding RTX toxin-like protein
LSRFSRRRGPALAILAAAFALLAFAPGALAASLGVDGSGNLVYTGAAGQSSAIEFDEVSAGTVEVHKVESGRSLNFGFDDVGPFTDNDAITVGANCDADLGDDGADTDANGDPVITCTGVTAGVVANTGDQTDAVDASGTFTDDGPGLVTLPLILNLGDGDDAAIGGAGDDVIHGNNDNDTIEGDTGGSGGGSEDQIFGDDGADAVIGGKGQDLVDGGAGDDDAVVGGPGPDQLFGGDGNDGFIQGGPGPDTIDGGAGDDSIGGDCFGDPCPIGSEGADTITGGAGNDDINGEGGNDTINGGDDNDDLTGGAGNDTIHGNAGDDSIEGDVCCAGSSPGDDQLFGDDGDDDIRGQGGNDTADGGAGDDFVAGGQGTDTVSGGDGDDFVEGAAGNDTASGGAGDDFVAGDCGGYQNCGDSSDGNDTVNGDAGQDFVAADAGTDVQDGGAGIDQIEYEDRYFDCTQPGPCVQVSHPVSVTLDGVANDGGPGENDTVNGFEDVRVQDNGCCGPAPEGGATIVGDAGVNSLSGSNVNDTIDGGTGNDFLFGNGGDDTINANDGFADRVLCGPGNDTANVDEFDQVGDDCETVNRTTRGQLASEDKPPTVTWTAPASGAKMSTSAANTLTVTATDDKGISQVVFMAGERVICTVTAAPYTCAYKPTDADVGRTTLTAIAIDTSQQTASAIRVVNVPRFKPSKVTSSTSPGKDSSAPFTFTTSGKISLPSGVTKATGCTGTVAVTFKAGKKTISTRKAKVTKSCTFRSKVTFSLPSRLHPKSLRVQSTFRGNAVLLSRVSSRKTVKVAS